MKRVVICILTVSLLIGALAVPSYAAEYSNYFELLDYSSANGVDNFAGLSAGSNYFSFELPDELIPQRFDILISSSTPIDAAYVSFGSNRYQLSVLSIGDGFYRLVGSFVVYNISSVALTIDVSSGGWIQFHSFKLFTTPVTTFDVPAEGTVSFGGGEEAYFYYNSDDDRDSAILPGSSQINYQQFDASIFIDDFAKYDQIDLQLYLSSISASSISISIDGQNIPFTTSLVNGDSSWGRYLVNLSIDTSILSPLSGPLEIVVLGDIIGIDNQVGLISILYSSGHVYGAVPNDNLFFFNKLKQFFIDQYNNLSGWISGAASSITTQIQQIEDRVLYAITVWSDLINNSIGSVGSKIDNWGQKIYDALIGTKDPATDSVISGALEDQASINAQINNQIDSAVQDWDENFGTVSSGFNTAFQNASPSLIWLSDKAQAVYNNMGWFGSIFFFLGFIEVFFLFMSKSGLGSKFFNGGGE